MDLLSRAERRILERLLALAGGDSHLLELAVLRAASEHPDGPTVDHVVAAIQELKADATSGASRSTQLR